ncbi:MULTISPECIES: DUF1254 domain-containing protein [Paraburkholderia]|uniref:Uncharacterized conserved protein n=1 Tax=Paraburkholderia tropica TaxID=92647 RepID=A0A1A5X1E1_9BURK|nr:MULTISPECIES: DUF1254 domain-containing protein [Paraburkholderia]MBB2984118.1 hypothetical protein [Paraburkholderia tropica]MBB2998993.1 hypothetical protein [Paraburkholderia tropica]MBB6318232.1 hypothetical protein [Paraburkholderia tropica]MDE1139160.1 DUF1254 domain-containing protein [Paraburkholderia tropica]OBR47149.1 hypothetical protein A6456_33485 [Paraburkholderia tropica]
MKRKRREFPFFRTCAALAGIALIAGCASAPAGVAPRSNGWVKDEVSDSYVFGYPLVLMDVSREAATGSAPGQAETNTLRHAQSLPPVGASSPPEPNLDTLASSGWFDVSREPVIVALPDTHGRYMDARALDMWTNVVWSTAAPPKERVAGQKAQTIAFVPAGWQGTLPARVKRIEVSTRYVWFLARIQTRGGGDIAAVRRLQRGIRVAPLSAWDEHGKRGAQADASSGAGLSGDPVATGAPGAQVAALDANGFFTRLAQAIDDNPSMPDDPHAIKILGDIGVHAGETAQLPSGSKDAALVAAGFEDGRARVATPPANLLAGNGWLWIGDDAGNYGPDYALRAYAAYTSPGLPTSLDEVRARVAQDSDGHTLNGANRYVIHFTAKQLPPVRGFWSITAYTTDGALDSDGPVRVAFGDRNGARRNRDGSLDVHVSAERPRGGANWVPVPKGDFRLVLRLYAPKPQATDGSWQPPAVERQ